MNEVQSAAKARLPELSGASALFKTKELAPPGTQPPQVPQKEPRRPSVARLLSWLIVVVLPSLTAIVYYGAVASDRYVSATEVIVSAEGEGAGAALSSLLGGVSGIGGGGISSQGQVLVAFVKSHDMLRRLEATIPIRQYFSDPTADYFSRMAVDASFEDRHAYYLRMLQVEWDGHSRIISLSVQAFRPEHAQTILGALLKVSEEQLNTMSLRQQEDSLSFAREELRRAEERLAAARAGVAAFRRQHAEIDPESSAARSGTLIGGLESKLAAARVELASLLTYVRPDAAQVKGLRNQIAQLETEIKRERAGLAGPNAGTLADLLSEYESLLIEEEFARDGYQSAMSLLELSRTQALRQHSYVIDFVAPNTPELGTEPQRLRMIVVVVLASLLLLAIGNLVVVSIKEHAGP